MRRWPTSPSLTPLQRSSEHDKRRAPSWRSQCASLATVPYGDGHPGDVAAHSHDNAARPVPQVRRFPQYRPRARGAASEETADVATPASEPTTADRPSAASRHHLAVPRQRRAHIPATRSFAGSRGWDSYRCGLADHLYQLPPFRLGDFKIISSRRAIAPRVP